MFGQPEGFEVARVIPTEVAAGGGAAVMAPAYIVDVNDTIKLKTFLHVDPTVFVALRRNIRIALVGGTVAGVAVPASGRVEYHLQDLVTGNMLTIAGGAIIELTPTSNPTRAQVLGPGGPLEGFPDTAGDDYYLSQDTTAITTGVQGSGSTLELPPAPNDSGTWRVLTHTHGGAGTFTSAFDDDNLIEVIA